jgi:hypothetical protein
MEGILSPNTSIRVSTDYTTIYTRRQNSSVSNIKAYVKALQKE